VIRPLFLLLLEISQTERETEKGMEKDAHRGIERHKATVSREKSLIGIKGELETDRRIMKMDDLAW